MRAVTQAEILRPVFAGDEIEVDYKDRTANKAEHLEFIFSPRICIQIIQDFICSFCPVQFFRRIGQLPFFELSGSACAGRDLLAD